MFFINLLIHLGEKYGTTFEKICFSQEHGFLKVEKWGRKHGRGGHRKTSGVREISELGFGQDKTDHKIVEASHNASGMTFGHANTIFS